MIPPHSHRAKGREEGKEKGQGRSCGNCLGAGKKGRHLPERFKGDLLEPREGDRRSPKAKEHVLGWRVR
jgi:hypothetical protein